MVSQAEWRGKSSYTLTLDREYEMYFIQSRQTSGMARSAKVEWKTV